MSTVAIKYDATDITAHVLLASAQFVGSARGSPGTCKFRVRDDGHEHAFVTGKSITLDIDGTREWTGFITTVRRGFFYSGTAKSAGDTERYFEIRGVDLNVLFQRRVLYDKVDGTKVQLTTYPPDTPDQTILLDYIDDHLDLTGDGLGTSMIEEVGTPSTDSEISGSAGWTWDQFMRFLTRNTGGIYYIDPDGEIVLTDVDTPDAPFGISDFPATVETESDDFTRTEASGWGMGPLGAWTSDSSASLDLSVDGDEGLIFANGPFNGFVWEMLPFTPVAGSQWSFKQRFQWPDTPDEIAFEIYQDPDFDYEFAAYLDGSGDLNIFGWFSGSVGDETVNVGTPTPGAWAYLELFFDDASGNLRARYWEEGDPQPDWQVELTAAALSGGTYNTIAVVGVVHPTETLRLDSLTVSTGAILDGASVGYRDLEIDFGGEGLRNDALMWGMGQGSTSPVFSRVTDDASVAEHGLWQVGSTAMVVWRQATIDRIANSFVYGSPQNQRGGKDDAVAVRCVIFRQGLRAGMKVPVTSEVWGFSDVLPIRSSTITFPTPTTPKYELILSHEIDDPWSTFEFWFPDLDLDLDLDIDIDFDLELPVFDPCADTGLCVEEFSRSASDWGTSEFGPDWTNPSAVEGKTATGDSGVMTIFGSNDAAVEDLELTTPVDVLVRWRFTGVTPDVQATFGVALDDPGTPNTYIYGEYQRNYSGSSDQISGGHNSDFDTDTGIADAPNGVWWFLRLRCDGSDAEITLWPEGGTEPAPQLVVAGAAWTTSPNRLYLYGDSGTAGQNVEIDYIRFDEGCSGTTVGELMGLFAPVVGGSAQLFHDDFERTTSGIGDPRYSPYDESGASVNGSELRVEPAAYNDWAWEAPSAHGVYQMDIWIPSDATEYGFYELDSADVGGVAGFLWVESQEDGDWSLAIGDPAGVDNYLFTPDGGAWYTVKLQISPTQLLLRGKVWERGGAEPGWQVERSYSGTPVDWVPYLAAMGAETEDARVDNLIVTSEYGCVTDDFERTVSPGWGHGDSLTWVETNTSGNPTGVASGRAYVTWTTIAHNLVWQIAAVTVDPSSSQLDLYFSFDFTELTGGAKQVEGYVLSDGLSGQAHVKATVTYDFATNTYTLSPFVSDDDSNTWGGPDIVVAANPGAPYRAHVRLSASLLEANLWLASSAEPETFASSSTHGVAGALSQIAGGANPHVGIFQADIPVEFTPHTAYIDDVTFCYSVDGNPCEDAGPGELADPAHSGSHGTTLDEVAAPVGEDPDSTYFIVPHYFYDRSERVFLNGLFLRPGADYATHPDDRLIEIFSSVTVDPGDVVSATYEIKLPVEVI